MNGYLINIIVEYGAKYQGKLLFEYIAEFCMKNDISGVSVFRAIKGYGKSHKIHEHGIFSKNEPVSIEIIEEKEKANRIIPILKELLKELNTGILTIEQVEIYR